MSKTLGEISNASAPAFKRGFQDALKTARKVCPYSQPNAIMSYNFGFQSGLSAYEEAIFSTYAQTKHTTK
jgi:ribosome modulation factor